MNVILEFENKLDKMKIKLEDEQIIFSHHNYIILYIIFISEIIMVTIILNPPFNLLKNLFAILLFVLL